MRKLTTSKGLTYEVTTAFAPLYDGSCVISLHDNRRLPEIAEEFDGLTTMHLIDTDVGEADFDGYNTLMSIMRVRGEVQMKLARG